MSKKKERVRNPKLEILDVEDGDKAVGTAFTIADARAKLSELLGKQISLYATRMASSRGDVIEGKFKLRRLGKKRQSKASTAPIPKGKSGKRKLKIRSRRKQDGPKEVKEVVRSLASEAVVSNFSEPHLANVGSALRLLASNTNTSVNAPQATLSDAATHPGANLQGYAEQAHELEKARQEIDKRNQVQNDLTTPSVTGPQRNLLETLRNENGRRTLSFEEFEAMRKLLPETPSDEDVFVDAVDVDPEEELQALDTKIAEENEMHIELLIKEAQGRVETKLKTIEGQADASDVEKMDLIKEQLVPSSEGGDLTSGEANEVVKMVMGSAAETGDYKTAKEVMTGFVCDPSSPIAMRTRLQLKKMKMEKEQAELQAREEEEKRKAETQQGSEAEAKTPEGKNDPPAPIGTVGNSFLPYPPNVTPPLSKVGDSVDSVREANERTLDQIGNATTGLRQRTRWSKMGGLGKKRRPVTMGGRGLYKIHRGRGCTTYRDDVKDDPSTPLDEMELDDKREKAQERLDACQPQAERKLRSGEDKFTPEELAEQIEEDKAERTAVLEQEELNAITDKAADEKSGEKPSDPAVDDGSSGDAVDAVDGTEEVVDTKQQANLEQIQALGGSATVTTSHAEDKATEWANEVWQALKDKMAEDVDRIDMSDGTSGQLNYIYTAPGENLGIGVTEKRIVDLLSYIERNENKIKAKIKAASAQFIHNASFDDENPYQIYNNRLEADKDDGSFKGYPSPLKEIINPRAQGRIRVGQTFTSNESFMIKNASRTAVLTMEGKAFEVGDLPEVPRGLESGDAEEDGYRNLSISEGLEVLDDMKVGNKDPADYLFTQMKNNIPDTLGLIKTNSSNAVTKNDLKDFWNDNKERIKTRMREIMAGFISAFSYQSTRFSPKWRKKSEAEAALMKSTPTGSDFTDLYNFPTPLTWMARGQYGDQDHVWRTAGWAFWAIGASEGTLRMPWGDPGREGYNRNVNISYSATTWAYSAPFYVGRGDLGGSGLLDTAGEQYPKNVPYVQTSEDLEDEYAQLTYSRPRMLRFGMKEQSANKMQRTFQYRNVRRPAWDKGKRIIPDGGRRVQSLYKPPKSVRSLNVNGLPTLPGAVEPKSFDVRYDDKGFRLEERVPRFKGIPLREQQVLTPSSLYPEQPFAEEKEELFYDALPEDEGGEEPFRVTPATPSTMAPSTMGSGMGHEVTNPRIRRIMARSNSNFRNMGGQGMARKSAGASILQ